MPSLCMRHIDRVIWNTANMLENYGLFGMKKSELSDYPTLEIPNTQVIWQGEGKK